MTNGRMDREEVEVIARYYERSLLDVGDLYYGKLPNEITSQDILDQPDVIQQYLTLVFQFEAFFIAEFEGYDLTKHRLFIKYKVTRDRAHRIDYMQLLTTARGTHPKARAFKLYTLKRYKRVFAALSKDKLLYAACLTSKGPNEWISPLTPYYFVRSYFFFKILQRLKKPPGSHWLS
jgi:hypothetical protein